MASSKENWILAQGEFSLDSSWRLEDWDVFGSKVHVWFALKTALSVPPFWLMFVNVQSDTTFEALRKEKLKYQINNKMILTKTCVASLKRLGYENKKLSHDKKKKSNITGAP